MKQGCKVETKNGLVLVCFAPSFEYLFEIISRICAAEDIKYPPKRGFRGRKMVEEILVDMCNERFSWDDLKKKYRIR